MTEEEKKLESKILPWRFWFSVALSAFLVLMFVYYLPLRFLSSVGMPGLHEDEMNAVDMHKEHGGTVPHEESEVTEGLAVNFSVATEPVLEGNPVTFNFFVNEKPDNIPVPSDKLEVEHTKLMHVIGVRDDMNEFFHIHPESFLRTEDKFVAMAPGDFSTIFAFQKPGRYKIWSQVTKDAVTHTFGHKPLTVKGAGERSNKIVSFGRNAIVGNYQISLKTDEPFVKGRTHELSFDIHALAGQEIGVEPYLGADMHLAIIKDDWTQFIHTHPESGDHMNLGYSWVPSALAHGDEVENGSGETDEAINFHVLFPEAGLYRAYAQFRPRGIDLPADEALTAMFWLKVEDKTQLPISPWWMLLLSSAALIIVLGVIVKKYLVVGV